MAPPRTRRPRRTTGPGDHGWMVWPGGAAFMARAVCMLGCSAPPGVPWASPHHIAVAPTFAAPPAPAPPASASPHDARSAPMVQVPAGPFVRGCDASDLSCPANEQPRGTLQLRAFEIDVAHVTVAAFRRCVAAGACSGEALDSWRDVGPSLPSAMCNFPRSDREDHPINCVDWDQAAAYCYWAGKRLPTEAEWEKAMRGPDGKRIPWDTDAPSCAHAMVGIALGGLEVMPSGDGRTYDLARSCTLATTRPAGIGPTGPYGTRDLPGNVWEWTADGYQRDAYDSAPEHDSEGAITFSRAVRGIRWYAGAHLGMREDDPGHHVDVFTRGGEDRGFRSYNLGFRCARARGVVEPAPRPPMPFPPNGQTSTIAAPLLDPATALEIGVLAGRCDASSAWLSRDRKELALCVVNLTKHSTGGITYYFYSWPGGRFLEVEHISSPLDLRRIRDRLKGFAPRPAHAPRLPFEVSGHQWD